MASAKNYFSKPSYRFLSGERSNTNTSINSEPIFEFDESELCNSNHVVSSPEFKKPKRSSRISRKSVQNNNDRDGATASSMPVNIPDWSKILRDDYRDNRMRENYEDEDGDEDESRVPPHEFLAKQFARTRVASFSVHEGVGRTLKGRDLSRVRDAIWEKTGFED